MATMQDGRSAERETAAARSIVYGFLARALAFPTDERIGALESSVVPAVGMVHSGDPQLDFALFATATALLRQPGEVLRRRHTAVFPPIESRDHPPYECAYASGDVFVQSDVMADVAAFYRAHGLRPGGPERERPDHICTELEFAAFLAHKEVVALDELGPAEVEECRRTQASFLADHLGCWGPAFGRRLAMAGGDQTYGAVGHVLRAWIEHDLEGLDVTPAQILDRPHPPAPPDDGSCGLDGDDVGRADTGATAVPLPIRRDGGRR